VAKKNNSTTKKTSATKKSERRVKGDGGLYLKTKNQKNPKTGQIEVVEYWQASQEVPREKLPENAPRVRITGSGATQKQALANLQRNYASYLEGASDKLDRRSRRKTLDGYFDEWYEGLQFKQLSDRMRRKHKRNYKLYISPYLGDIAIRDLTYKHLNAYMWNSLPQITYTKKIRIKNPGEKSYLENRTKLLSISTRKNIYTTLSKILNEAVRERIIASNPLSGVAIPKPERDDNEDVVSATENALALMVKLKKDNHPDYCRFLLQLLAMRRGERLGLTWDEVHLEVSEPYMYINKQLDRYENPDLELKVNKGKKRSDFPQGWFLKPHTKTRNNRTVLLTEPFLSALKNYKKTWDSWNKEWSKTRPEQLKAHKKWVDGGKIGEEPKVYPPIGFENSLFLRKNGTLIRLSDDNDDWHKILKDYEFSYWRGHLNRHITATLLADLTPPPSEMVVKSILGHESTSMTYWYARLRANAQKPALSQYHKQFFSNPKTSNKQKNTKKKSNLN
jgi:integrase